MTSLVVKHVKLFKYANIIEWFICEINMLNYLFHLISWTNKDLKKLTILPYLNSFTRLTTK